MRYYPVYLDLRERPCVIVGGGQVAERKCLPLIEAGATVTIVSPALTPKLRDLAASGKIVHSPKRFEDHDISGAYLVIAATDDRELNSAIGSLCRRKQILVNVVAPPEQSTFIVPSVIDRGDLLIAVSTSGSSPALSRKIRQELEARYGPAYEMFLEKMARLRARLMEERVEEPMRRSVFQTLVDSDVLELLTQGREHDADHRIQEILRGKTKKTQY